MKQRLIYLAAILVIFFSVGVSLMQPLTANAASEYFYTNDSFNGIQGPNPFRVADQPENVTYGKAGQLGKGIYIAQNAPRSDNSGKTCYPAIQTNSKEYDGDKNAKLYVDCGFPDHSDPQGNRRSITIGESSANPNTPAGGAAAAGDTEPTCETSGGPLSWMLCPIFNLMADSSQWIFQNIVEPFLITPPISTDPSDPSFQIWSNLRIYGNIFLIIALLVIVFGESIGGGLIDAYTAKKVLPRLLVAAVLINLSIYIVAFLVDLSNILGQGVGAILTSPLTHCAGGGGGNCWDFQLTTGDQARVFGVGLIGFLFSSTAIAGFLGSIIFGGFAGIGAAITVAFFVMLPIFFSILAVFITLIIRKGLILMLVLISPVAFALYCLPNTQRFFKRWWDLLIEALMVYPIIIAIFGIAEILSVTVLSANGISASDLQGSGISDFVAGNLNRTLALVVAFLLQFLPLLAVPFSFRIAGGALARIYEAATGAGTQLNKLAEGRREHAKRDYKAGSDVARGRIYHGARDWGQRHQGPLGVGRMAGRWVGNRAGGYNIEAVLSAGRAEVDKQMEEQIAAGRDEEIRGLSVNKQWALRSGQEGADWRTREDGIREFKTLGGAWISEQDVDAGHRRWGNNQHAQQKSLSYEMRKAITEEDTGRIASHYQAVATEPGGWGMSDSQAQGALIGAAFANQNQHVEFKYTGLNGQLNNAHGLVDEIYNNRGSYQMSQMNSHTIEQLKVAHEQAVANHDADQQEKIAAIAETFMHSTGIANVNDEGEPIPAATGQTRGRQVSTQGSAHTAERVRELADMTGVLQRGPEGEYTNPDHAPTPNRREQS